MSIPATISPFLPQNDDADTAQHLHDGERLVRSETIAAAHDKQVDTFKATLSDTQKAAFVDPLTVTQNWGAGGSNFTESAAFVEKPGMKAFEATLSPAQQQQYQDLKNPNPAVHQWENGVESVKPAGAAALSNGFNAQANPQMGQFMQVLAQLFSSLMGGKNGFDLSQLFGAPGQAQTSVTTPGAGQPKPLAAAAQTPDQAAVKMSAVTVDPATSRLHVDQEITVTAPEEAEMQVDAPVETALLQEAPLPAFASPTLAQWSAQPGGKVQYDAAGTRDGVVSTASKLSQSGVYANAFNDMQQTQLSTGAKVADPTAVPAVWTPPAAKSTTAVNFA